MSDDRKDYEVGYCKPPKEHQFKPGQSGNPKGRSQKSRWRKSTDTLRVEFIDAMERQIAVRENGRARTKPAIRALYDQLLSKALKGDFRTAKLIFETYSKFITEDEDAHVRLIELLNEIEAAKERRLRENR